MKANDKKYDLTYRNEYDGIHIDEFKSEHGLIKTIEIVGKDLELMQQYIKDYKEELLTKSERTAILIPLRSEELRIPVTVIVELDKKKI